MSEACSSESAVDTPSDTTEFSKLLLLYSFGHQYGAPELQPSISADPSMPREPFLTANHLIDARVLPNPPRDIRKQFTGLSTTFQNTLLLDDEKGRHFYDSAYQSITAFLHKLEPYAERCLVKIGIGCRMGKHRSVATVECLARDLREHLGEDWKVITRHRDLTRKKDKKVGDNATESDRD